MRFLDKNLSETTLKILPDDSEVQLRIAAADVVPNKNFPERSNLRVRFDVCDDPLVEDIMIWLPIPTEETPQKQAFRQNARIESFFKAFGLPTDPDSDLETSDMVSKEGWAIIAEEVNRMDGSPQNGVRRFVASR